MGTSKSGRYLNTKGSGTSPSHFAIVHSNEGKYVRGSKGHRCQQHNYAERLYEVPCHFAVPVSMNLSDGDKDILAISSFKLEGRSV